MRARAVRMIVSIVAVVCVLMGLPGAFFASASIWSSEQRNLDVQAQLILQSIELWGRGLTRQPWPRLLRIKRTVAAMS